APPRVSSFPYTTLFRSQRVNVERPMPRCSAISRLVRPPICASRTASCSNSFVKRNCFVIKASFYTKKTSPLLRTKLKLTNDRGRSEEHTSELQSRETLV